MVANNEPKEKPFIMKNSISSSMLTPTARRRVPIKEVMALPRAKLGGRARTAPPLTGDSGKPHLCTEFRPDRRKLFSSIDLKVQSDPLALKRIGIMPARPSSQRMDMKPSNPMPEKQKGNQTMITAGYTTGPKSSSTALEARLAVIERMRRQELALATRVSRLRSRVVKTGWDLKLQELERLEYQQAQAVAEKESIWNRLHSTAPLPICSTTITRRKRASSADIKKIENNKSQRAQSNRTSAATARPNRIRRHPPTSISECTGPIDIQLKAVYDRDCQLSLYHDFLGASLPEKDVFKHIPELNDVWFRPWRCKFSLII